MFENLLLARDGAVAVLTVNRPQVLNALNLPLAASVCDAAGATAPARKGRRAFLVTRAPAFGAPRTAGASQGLDG